MKTNEFRGEIKTATGWKPAVFALHRNSENRSVRVTVTFEDVVVELALPLESAIDLARGLTRNIMLGLGDDASSAELPHGF